MWNADVLWYEEWSQYRSIGTGLNEEDTTVYSTVKEDKDLNSHFINPGVAHSFKQREIMARFQATLNSKYADWAIFVLDIFLPSNLKTLKWGIISGESIVLKNRNGFFFVHEVECPYWTQYKFQK